MTWVLMALMFFVAPDGDIAVRRWFTSTPDATACLQTAREVEDSWRGEKPTATILVKCVTIKPISPT